MKTILSIAQSIRKKCEKFALSNDSVDYDFNGNKDLACMCAVASFALYEALRQQGITCKVIKGIFYEFQDETQDYRRVLRHDTHCWVKVGKKIVDITATQFGDFPKVYVVSSKDKRYSSLRIVKDYGCLSDWDGQKPSSDVSKKILTLP